MRGVMGKVGALLIIVTMLAFVIFCVAAYTLSLTGHLTTEMRAGQARFLTVLMGLQCFGIALGVAGSRK